MSNFRQLLLFVSTVLWLSNVAAQSVPSTCRPSGPPYYDCVMSFPNPYVYLAGSCAGTTHQTESAAFAVYRQQFSNSQCPPTFSLQGWINPGPISSNEFIIACGGYPSSYPVNFYGRESTNWLLEEVTKYSPAPVCSNAAEFVYGAVRRERTFTCPEGYSWFTSDVCYRLSGNRDYGKNYGDSCPPKGECKTANPINVGAGNKYRAEPDYRAGGNSPISFTRYYNSLPENASFSHHYKDSNYELAGGGGTGGYSLSSMEPGQRNERLGLVAIGAVGVGWRHTYQRVIYRQAGTLLTTAYVHRQDAKVIAFTKMSGQWYAPADVNIRLEETHNGSGEQIGFKLTLDDDSTETYDIFGRLATIRDRSGIEQVLNYDDCGRLHTVTDSFGKAVSFSYSTSCSPAAEHRLTMLTVPGGTYHYGYDSSGRLTSVTDPDGKTRQYHYENTAFKTALTGITDESEQRFATFGYDAYGRANLSELAGGAARISIVYPGSAIAVSAATVTTALGASIDYAFVVKQGVVKVGTQSSYCDGCPVNAKSLTYDANGNISIRKDFKNAETRFTHDLARNLETSRIEAYGTARARTISTGWHSTFRLPVLIEEPGKRTTLTHDANGNVLTKTTLDTATNESRTWTYTYNAFGQVLTADGPRTDASDVTTYTYYNCATGYQCGQVATITNALEHVTTYNTYNAHGQPLTITDPNGVVTTLTYDLRQRLTSRTVGTEQTTFEYWPTGLLKKATLPDGSYLEYTYDAAHRLTDINDSEGNRIHYTLDAMGNRTKEDVLDSSQALSRTRNQIFNVLNQLSQQIGAAGGANVTTTFGYDNNGNQTSIAAPLGRSTTQTYDELNRLSSVTDPESGLTQYGYDALDQLISVTDPKGLTTSYTYNGLGDIKQQVSPDTGTTTNTYDSGGNLKTSTDARAVITTYTYDALNRVKTAAFKKGTTTDQTITYSYDAGTFGKGRLTGASDSAHSLAWTYDDQGRTLTARQNVGAISKTTSYAHASGQRTSMTTPSGQLIAYGYTNGQVTSISVNGASVLSNVLYDPFGPVRQWTWGNGTLSARTFDQDGKITQLDSAGLKTYAYDDAFRITGITDTTSSALSWSYSYDDLDRLTSATKTGTALGYTYDANGNRLTQTGTGAATFTVAANSNRLSSTSGALARTYGYDNAGNTTSFTGITFAYNNRGRMKSSTKSGVTTNYTYNALGQLIKIGSRALYYYDEAGQILGIYNGSGALSEEIVWLGDIPVATLRPNGSGGVNIFYIHTDHLNAPRLITQPINNAVRWRWDANPFGGGATNENPSGLGAFAFTLRFPGQMYVAETGLYYNYFRDYDPATGRYVESDPIGLGGGINTYAYALNNPLLHVDPLGLEVKICCRKAELLGGAVSHCWLKTDSVQAGMASSPQCRANVGDNFEAPWITKTYVSDHSCEKPDRCTDPPPSWNIDEDCVNKELAIGRYLGRFDPFLNNCQQFAFRVLQKCRKGRGPSHNPPANP